MNLLLDTHAFLWAVGDVSQLSEEARVAIEDGKNVVFVSAVTAWEISIKKSIGKLKIPDGNYLDELRTHRFTPFDITTEHALAVEALPHHHRDPFDRLLIAQAQTENFTLVTRDTRISKYSVKLIKT